ncbi:TPA: 5'-nucleotidase [Neisseria meningitidis]
MSEKKTKPSPKKGVVFPFIKKLLSINEINPNDPTIGFIILLSRNNPDTDYES